MSNDTPVEVIIEYREGAGRPKKDWQPLRSDIKAKMGNSRFQILTPEQLSQSRSRTINSTGIQANANLVWTDSKLDDFSTTLFVDASEVHPDDQDTKNANTIVKVFLDKIVSPNDRDGAKILPRVKFTFGSFIYDGYITKFEEKYIYFSSKGHPLRAEISFTIKRNFTVKQAEAESTPDNSRSVRVVKAGDRLDIIADDYYGDPALWREIALENNIQRPRLFPGPGDLGRELLLPDLANKR